MYNSLNMYYQSDQYMMTENHIGVKYPFKVRLMDFKLLKHERFVDMVSESMLQLIFKKLSLVKLADSVKNGHKYLKKATKILPIFHNTIFVQG